VAIITRQSPRKLSQLLDVLQQRLPQILIEDAKAPAAENQCVAEKKDHTNVS
jgi:hypothetical protein